MRGLKGGAKVNVVNCAAISFFAGQGKVVAGASGASYHNAIGRGGVTCVDQLGTDAKT